MSDQSAVCQICGLPMPPGEEMFNYHGYSGPCPVTPTAHDNHADVNVQANLVSKLREAAAEIERLRARVAELEALLREAVEDIEGWAGYASAYFQDKHDLPGCLARYRSALAQQEGEG